MDLQIEVTQEVIDAHTKINSKEGKWAIFKADEKKEKAILDSEGGLDSDFKQFKDTLPDNEPR